MRVVGLGVADATSAGMGCNVCDIMTSITRNALDLVGNGNFANGAKQRPSLTQDLALTRFPSGDASTFSIAMIPTFSGDKPEISQ